MGQGVFKVIFCDRSKSDGERILYLFSKVDIKSEQTTAIAGLGEDFRTYPIDFGGENENPLLYGGAQERELRPGTLNTPGIVGLGEACALRYQEMEEDETRIAQNRDRLQSLLIENIPNLIINGDIHHRLAGNLHISIPHIPNSAIIARIRHQLALSTGAACSSGTPAPSHVLRAMQLPEPEIDGALRISLGKFTTKTEINRAASILIEAITQLNQLLT